MCVCACVCVVDSDKMPCSGFGLLEVDSTGRGGGGDDDDGDGDGGGWRDGWGGLATTDSYRGREGGGSTKLRWYYRIRRFLYGATLGRRKRREGVHGCFIYSTAGL